LWESLGHAKDFLEFARNALLVVNISL